MLLYPNFRLINVICIKINTIGVCLYITMQVLSVLFFQPLALKCSNIRQLLQSYFLMLPKLPSVYSLITVSGKRGWSLIKLPELLSFCSQKLT